LLLAATVVAHAAVVALAGVLGTWLPAPATPPPPPTKERVTMRVVERQPKEPTAAPEVAKPEPKPAPRQERPQRNAPLQRAPQASAETAPEPATPEATVNEPGAVENATPRRRIVGISFESTVAGGNGPKFAVGNSRLGRTDRIASEPQSRPPNRVATRTPGAVVVKPSRIERIEPDYPALLRAQGIEGDVMVLIAIDSRGKVERVELLRPARHEELNRAALDAAGRERFSPATKDGEPIRYTLRFTYRFRLDEV